ncbi:MAG: NADH-quinone oxidoreductase subunit J [Chloroflexi bacterium]|nr:NADH-quinone oxidoreductase subunit J [Chloroflexota bacterium]
MVEQIIFILVSAFTLSMAVVVVTKRNLFHAALALMATFLGVAGLYAMLDAGFLAAAQLLVYIGAISILVIFAIMMTRRLMQTDEPAFNSQAGFALVTAVLSFGILFWVFFMFRDFWPVVPNAAVPLASRTQIPQEMIQDSVAMMGRAFVDPAGYVLPFEIASILLLAALVGAIIVAWPKAEDKA